MSPIKHTAILVCVAALASIGELGFAGGPKNDQAALCNANLVYLSDVVHEFIRDSYTVSPVQPANPEIENYFARARISTGLPGAVTADLLQTDRNFFQQWPGEGGRTLDCECAKPSGSQRIYSGNSRLQFRESRVSSLDGSDA